MQRKDGLYGLADIEGAANYRPKLAPFESTTEPEWRISVKKKKNVRNIVRNSTYLLPKAISYQYWHICFRKSA